MRDLPFKILGSILIVTSFTLAWMIMDLDAFINKPMELKAQDQRVVIPPRSNLNEVAERLVTAGLIEHPRYFVWYARIKGAATQIRAGEYSIDASMTPKQFLERIVAGAVAQYALTLVEGWNFQQVLAAINSTEQFQHLLAGASPEQIMARIGAAQIAPEGQFLPDTYYFPAGTSDVEFLKRAYDAMQEQIKILWPQRKQGLPYNSPYEALIMASIVEKETGIARERPLIAGVFVRRLQTNMRLQTDPTVIYGMGDRYDGNIHKDDLQRDTPYNTYTRAGLPPTPIAMPSEAAIRAALNPARTDALYFVARGNGSHVFSSNLDAHNRAVNRYQR